jgi:hypothetical protein
MLTFKQFIDEATRRKPKKNPDDDWVGDYASGYADLRSMQAHLTESNLRLQMFVPKHRDPKVQLAWERDRRYRDTKREVEAEEEAKLKEDRTDRPPILTAFNESPVKGDNKPSGAFWTSTAQKKSNGEWSSDWYEYVRNTFRTWQTDYGYLFAVKPQAMVIASDRLEQYYEWAERAQRLEKNSEYFDRERGSTRMRGNFPWKELSKHFDGVHHHGYSHRGDDFTYGWDVESTAWFNTSVLEYKGAVRLWHGHEDDDE